MSTIENLDFIKVIVGSVQAHIKQISFVPLIKGLN